MAEITAEQFRRQLAQDHLAGLTVLAGEEKFLVKQALQRLVKLAGQLPLPEFNFQEFPGEAEIDAIADAVEALPLMAPRKVVLVRDLDPDALEKSAQAKLEELLESVPEGCGLVLAYPTLEKDAKRPPAKWKRLLEIARKNGDLVLCARHTAGELQTMLCQRAAREGCTLSRREAGKLLEAAGQDMTRLRGEMDKLCAYALATAPAGETPVITGEIIEELVPRTLETTVFRLSDTLTAGNYQEAYRLLDALLTQREDPVGILAVLSGAYVDMARVKTALESGLPASAAGEYGDYGNRKFRLENAQRSARRMSLAALQKSLDLMLEADSALKGSRLEKRFVLEELIARLLAAREGL